MKDKKLSVREWQEQYRVGAYDAKDRITQIKAGWYDWFCPDVSLAGRLHKLASLVMRIGDPFILDNYYIWLKNNCPVVGPLYDDVRFEPLTGNRDGKYFLVLLNSPHERRRWTLYTERTGFDTPEYACGDVRRMARYINDLGPQLQEAALPVARTEKK